ncbi:hypothetical protein AB0I49_35390 [Streptomyces sp. NPDC050617]|uniref:hypothetical protein n=1 Tax=Streptomyces sp. NPDC050617 TaxID=3154628 RepID=UPI003422896E
MTSTPADCAQPHRRHRKIGRHTGVAAATAVALLAPLTACSDPQREYAVPSKLCGIRLDKSLYAPIFPAGKQEKQEDPIKGEADHEQCNVYIDGFVKITVSGLWTDRTITPQPTLATLVAEHGPYKAERVPGKYPAATWPSGALTLVECPNPKYRANLYSLTIATQTIKDHDKSHDVLGKLIQAYTEKVLEMLPCGKS